MASLLLMPKSVTRIGVVGGGVQAIWQLRFLKKVTKCREVLVLTRSAGFGCHFEEELRWHLASVRSFRHGEDFGVHSVALPPA